MSDAVGLGARKKGIAGKMALVARYRYVYFLILPGVLFLLVFRFLPMWGLILSVKEYNPFSGSIWGGKWYGFKYFIELFTDKYFFFMTRNTIAINLLRILFFFPLPIILALMLSEVRHDAFKRINQSIVYLPHFLSWVVIVSMTSMLLSTDIGIVNKLIRSLGQKPIAFLSDPKLFWPLFVGQTIWRETGWGTILFLAAITGIDPQLYEAAVMDGATRLQQITKITIPGIVPTIIILLIIRVGQIASLPLEQVLLMQNPLVMEVSVVFDTYAFTQGIMRGQVSVGVAVGLVKGLVGVVFIVSTNKLMKRLGYDGLY